MKKYLWMIFAALTAISALMGESRQMPDNPFSKEDYQKLSALQFDGYEDMTVSDYRSQVAKLTDTAEYRDLFRRVSEDETLYGLRDTDETAAFLFYVLEPLTAEKWESRDYSGSAASGFPCPEDNAMLEYVFRLTILDADALTVREYTTTRLSVISGMEEILRSKTKEELQDTNTNSMLTQIQTDTDNLIRQLQTEKIGISIEYAYFPLSAQNDDSGDAYFEDAGEQRRHANGTEQDYDALFALKTPDYQDMTLAEFNSALLTWTNENSERMERIDEDAGWNDFQVALTDEELSFVKLTVFLSGMENGKAIQSIYTGMPADDPYYSEELPQKTANENGAAWCSLYYRFTYSISDTEAVTVGERDRRIEGMINAVRGFWNNTDIESVLKMSESDIAGELEKIAAAYSTDKVTIKTGEEQMHFECMDERNILN